MASHCFFHSHYADSWYYLALAGCIDGHYISFLMPLITYYWPRHSHVAIVFDIVLRQITPPFSEDR
jgi:hypothetical protein